MSRFSKAEVEARGWSIAHERDEYEVVTSETQGERRIVPATYRAEKMLDTGHLLNEEATSMGLLLERITLVEKGLEAAKPKVVEAPIPTDVPLDEAGIIQRNVIVRLPDGSIDKISEPELASRQASGAVFTDEGMVTVGPTREAESAQEAKDLVAREKEDARTAQVPAEEATNVQIDNEDLVDSPGKSGGSSLVVGSTPLVSEDERASAGQGIGPHGPLGPEGVMGEEPSVVEAPDESGSPEGQPSVSEVRSEAMEEKAKELRDEKGAEADKPENVQEVREAGHEAEAKMVEEAQEADSEVDATPAAEEPAKEEGVDAEGHPSDE